MADLVYVGLTFQAMAAVLVTNDCFSYGRRRQRHSSRGSRNIQALSACESTAKVGLHRASAAAQHRL